MPDRHGHPPIRVSDVRLSVWRFGVGLLKTSICVFRFSCCAFRLINVLTVS
jgi:hypothetical protein